MLKKCFLPIHENVTFSVVFPLKEDTSQSSDSFKAKDTICEDINYITLTTNVANYEQRSKYPNNLLRNLARKSAFTSYTLVLDIDMIPSSNLVRRFMKFVNSSAFDKKEKAVFILPAYEIREGLEAPLNKISLLELRRVNAARPFYQELCPKCQVV